jgi:hypothetical protein
MTRSMKDRWCAENRPCWTQWLRQYVTQHHPCLQPSILLALWADLLQFLLLLMNWFFTLYILAWFERNKIRIPAKDVGNFHQNILFF